jgi:A/G-specific adenine glycosylase
VLLSDVVHDWFLAEARDLPWRRTDTTPWGVMVSEFMLQQTPVARVEPVWTAWMATWPTPAALAAAGRAEVLRAWGKLGYPRRALRLHAAAEAIRDAHGGVVPSDVDALEALPGVGAYTARAVAAFGYGRRCPVVDTNVRRVVARAIHGAGDAGPSRVAADLADVDALLPAADEAAFHAVETSCGTVRPEPRMASFSSSEPTGSGGRRRLMASYTARRRYRPDECPRSSSHW